LFLNPVGVLLAKGLGSRLTAAVLMNSVVGALCVVVTMAFLRRAGLSELIAVLFAAILGFSSTHISFGSTPETWIFAALAVILLFFLALAAPGRTAAFLPAGIFAAGMLTTNVVPAVFAFAAGLFKRVSFGLVIIRTLIFGVLVTGCAAALSIVQKLLYPRSAVFFLPDAWLGELGAYSPVVKYSGGVGLNYVWARLIDLGGVFFLFNVVALETAVGWYSVGGPCLPLKPFVNVDLPRLGPLGIAAAVIWVGLIIWAAYSFFKHRENRTPVLYGLLAVVAFNLLFYFFYGTTLYVYAICNAFPLLAAVALALRPYGRPGGKTFYVLAAVSSCFVILEAINSLRFMYRILAVFRDYPFPLTP
jgi:hypothetical protein